MRGEDQGARTCEEYPHVTEWEAGLPSSDDLMPLSQPLIPAELASAFSIYTEPSRTALDVARASHSTVSALRSRLVSSFPPSGLDSLPSFEEEDTAAAAADSEKGRRLDLAAGEEADDDHAARTLKRPRLVWTPQLHKRFVDVVAHLGIKNAVPKTIMQLMNVEGLTRENVASHLQKYRLYLKRMQGFSGDGPSSSDPLFASTPVPQSLHDPGDHPVSVPSPYSSPFLPMPVLGVVPHEGYRSEHLPPMPMSNPGPSGTSYRGFESHPYNIFSEQRLDWLGNKFGSTPFYPHLMQGDK